VLIYGGGQISNMYIEARVCVYIYIYIYIYIHMNIC